MGNPAIMIKFMYHTSVAPISVAFLNRLHMAAPLVDGMVLNRRTLGVMARQAAINISRRRRLENER